MNSALRTPHSTLSDLPGLLVLLILLLAPGCVTQTPGRVLATTVATVDAAMQGWATWVALGHATSEQELAVRAAYERYQALQHAAEAAYVAAAKTSDPSVFQRASAALTAAQGDLLYLLAKFTPSPGGEGRGEGGRAP